MFGRVRRIHLVGIGGTGMSGIAEILLNLGFEVTGSDLRRTDVTERLEGLGAEIVEGHESDLVCEAHVVVVSSAIRKENPEVRKAAEAGIAVIPRAELLAELMRVKRGIAIGGAHGKTTTTWLTALVLAEADLDPTIVVGGRLKQLGTNAKLGGGEFLVAEADESDGTFLMLAPTIAVATNIDREHLDFYPDLDAIREAFLRFLNRVPFFGVAIVNGDDPELRSLLPSIARRTMTYGMEENAEVRAENLRPSGRSIRFTVRARGEKLGEIALHVPGRHNVLNALAAVSVGIELEIPFAKIASGLESFRGIHRRLEVRGERAGRLVIDDYGHHPTEVRATLRALREAYPGRRLVVLFQPHRYTRTSALLAEFATAFEEAQLLFLLDIYPAGEVPVPGVDSGLLARAIAETGKKSAEWIRDRREAAARLAEASASGDLILTLGAGDVIRHGDEILEELSKREGPEEGKRE
ncbi:MAG: UDP-N-acetylmuramate--L-alanine ligase [Candidatus Eisenbacteria bacterium]|nr:UDP-N-acetylmuramate--L-alanine ligase [Candidatus Eisenbacteria bacterium]